MTPTCRRRCPQHGDRCPVVDYRYLPPEYLELAKKLAPRTEERHSIHLCLADPDHPHTWKSGREVRA